LKNEHSFEKKGSNYNEAFFHTKINALIKAMLYQPPLRFHPSSTFNPPKLIEKNVSLGEDNGRVSLRTLATQAQEQYSFPRT
jgi:hypothetical protein